MIGTYLIAPYYPNGLLPLNVDKTAAAGLPHKFMDPKNKEFSSIEYFN
jgi:hypothetical protein